MLILSDQIGSRSILRELQKNKYMHGSFNSPNYRCLKQRAVQNFSDHYPILLNENFESGAKEITQTCHQKLPILPEQQVEFDKHPYFDFPQIISRRKNKNGYATRFKK